MQSSGVQAVLNKNSVFGALRRPCATSLKPQENRIAQLQVDCVGDASIREAFAVGAGGRGTRVGSYQRANWSQKPRLRPELPSSYRHPRVRASRAALISARRLSKVLMIDDDAAAIFVPPKPQHVQHK